MVARIQITGLQKVFKKLEGLNRTVRGKLIRKAIDRGTVGMLKTARQLAPVETRLLKKSLGRRIKLYRTSGNVVAVIGPRKGFKRKVRVPVFDKSGKRVRGKTREQVRDPRHYTHLVEFGTEHSAAKPFLRPAFDRNKDQAKSIIKNILWAGIKAHRGF